MDTKAFSNVKAYAQTMHDPISFIEEYKRRFPLFTPESTVCRISVLKQIEAITQLVIV